MSREQEVPGEVMKRQRVFYVLYGHGDDRDVLRVLATDYSDAIHQAYCRVGPVHSAWPARRTKEEIKRDKKRK